MLCKAAKICVTHRKTPINPGVYTNGIAGINKEAAHCWERIFYNNLSAGVQTQTFAGATFEGDFCWELAEVL